MKIPESVLDTIQERVSIEDVVGDYVTLSYKNNRYWGLCPFHNEKTPSFSVTHDKGLFYCFGCGKGGTMFTFLQEIENCTFPESVEMLASRAGVRLDLLTESGEGDSKRRAIFELLGRVAKSFQYILLNRPEGKKALEYLERRGLERGDIERFCVGYAPEDRYWLKRFLKKKNYSEEFLRESGLFSKKYPEVSFFSRRIIFPIHSIQGDVIGFGGRLISGEGPKYINSPESEYFKKGDNLYGLYESLKQIRRGKEFILVEGYTDVIAMHKAGFEIAVAPLGTAFTSRQAQKLGRYADTGILVFDGDEAGKNAAKKAANLLNSEDIRGRVTIMPEGDDPADIISRDGIKALQNMMKYSINSFEYLMNEAIARFDVRQPEGKEAVARELFPYIREIASEVKREAVVKELAEALDIDEKSIIRDYLTGSGRTKTTETDNLSRNANKFTAELYLMIAVTVNREYFTLVRTALQPSDLQSEWARELYIALEECYRNEEDSTESVLNRLENEELKKIILRKMSSEEFTIQRDEVVKQSLYRIKQNSLEYRRKKLSARIEKMEKSGDEDLTELLSEKMHLDEELEELRVRYNVRTAE
ncbi:MAG: DNA primase [Spirochaetia bacterium]